MSSEPTTEPPPPSGEFADLQFRSITGPSIVSSYVDGANSDLFTIPIFNAGPASANVNVLSLCRVAITSSRRARLAVRRGYARSVPSRRGNRAV
jgi:hypothetical protein